MASERFEAWWQEHGQYSRAGGGDYEKTFAFNAWRAALEAAAQAVEKHDMTGREWVKDSLWGNLSREAAGRIYALAPTTTCEGER